MSRGFALPELVIAMLILGIALVPLAGLFTQGSLRAGISALQYQAMTHARAELEELRQVPYARLAACAHGWRAGGALFRASEVSPHVKLTLPASYDRIETACEVGPEVAHGVSLMRRVTVRVRWQEQNAAAAISTLETLIGDHAVLKGVR